MKSRGPSHHRLTIIVAVKCRLYVYFPDLYIPGLALLSVSSPVWVKKKIHRLRNREKV